MGWVRQTRRIGVRVQEPVVEPPQEVRPARTWWMWAGLAVRRTSLQRGGTASPAIVDADGGHDEGLRRSRGQACRGKAGHRSRRPVSGERGNRFRVALLPAVRAGGGEALRLLMTPG